MKTTVIVHEDNEPFIRIQKFSDPEQLTLTLARTHNALLDSGYGLVDTREKNDQRVATYNYVKLKDEQRHKVYVGVINE